MFVYSEHFAKKGANEHLADTRFEHVYLRYPVPGHSRMPIDGDFGRITSRRNRIETLSYPSDVVRIIQQAQVEKPFRIVYVNNNLTDDLCDDGHVVLDVKDFKTALNDFLLSPKKANLNLQNCREFMFKRGKLITINFSERFDYGKRDLCLFKVGVNAEKLGDVLAGAMSCYDDFLPISEVKLKNVEELTK
ncbi:unnamed protein product [Allacma fusca]|uniref:Uncharacterized protein n=1 Tax=Allacma fusca TaxID=39272 RepID=A0A8J2KBI4_9HEXA|nr:unnamed protein product [Allacma fusca]